MISSLFLETSSSEKVIKKIKSGEWKDIMDGLCTVNGNLIILDNIYFKHFATTQTYNIILSHVMSNIDNILMTHEDFIVHINMKNLTVSDVNKHLNFIQHVSILFKEKYSNKLTNCFVHNAPFVFTQILNIISMFIDKETQLKIKLISK